MNIEAFFNQDITKIHRFEIQEIYYPLQKGSNMLLRGKKEFILSLKKNYQNKTLWNVRFKPTLLIEESLMKECRASVGRSSHSVEQIPLENRWEYSLKLIVAVFSLRGHSQTRFTKFGFF